MVEYESMINSFMMLLSMNMRNFFIVILLFELSFDPIFMIIGA